MDAKFQIQELDKLRESIGNEIVQLEQKRRTLQAEIVDSKNLPNRQV